jgi:hypothetical protein
VIAVITILLGSSLAATVDRNPCGVSDARQVLVISPYSRAGSSMCISLSIVRPIIAGILALLSSCASEAQMTAEAQGRAEQASITLSHAPVCCARLDSISYVPLTHERTSVEMQPDKAPVRIFATGASFFVAVKLPNAPRPLTIGIQSALLNGGRGEIPTVFVPSVLTLDANFGELGAASELPLGFRRGWNHDGVGYFSELSVSDPAARYLIFFSDQTRLKQPIPYRSEAETAGGGVPIAVNVHYELPRSVNGHLDVWLHSAATEVRPH